MKNLLESASKIVLIMTAAGLVTSLLAVVIINVKNELVINGIIAIFSTFLGSVGTYYFTKNTPKK